MTVTGNTGLSGQTITALRDLCRVNRNAHVVSSATTESGETVSGSDTSVVREDRAAGSDVGNIRERRPVDSRGFAGTHTAADKLPLAGPATFWSRCILGYVSYSDDFTGHGRNHGTVAGQLRSVACGFV